ncbi:MAG: NAD(P)/FAD-dependent oxidoreductase [Acidobacteriota bacterium]|nr:NAD(P)/FAD-dependent oxidoreductase [Acidobacteriota bacterium]
MSSQWDVAVIGAGHNGLTAATYLAKRGRSVVLLERRDRVGGVAASEEFSPGYRTAGVVHETATLRPWAVEELGLSQQGLVKRAEASPILIPTETGPGYVHWRDSDRAADEISQHSSVDAERYREFRSFVARLSPVLRKVFDEPLADLEALDMSDLWDLGRKAVALRLLGKGDMMELFRIVPMCVGDWLREWFEAEIVSTALAAPALAHGMVGPWSPGTNLNLLLHEALFYEEISGGPAALVSALEKAAVAAGVEIRTEAEVTAIDFEGDGVSGVVLSDGERIGARQVAASCDPKALFLELIPAHYLAAEFEREIALFRTRGIAAKIDLALSGYPVFSCRPDVQLSRVRTGTNLNHVERSFDAVKYRQMSDEPTLDLFVPTVDNPDLAPSGHHVVSILVQWVPYELEGGWNEGQKNELLERTLATLDRYASGIRDLTVGHRVLSPVDLESAYGVSGGHLLHGEHAADQLLTRPVGGCTGYTTPFQGLYLCGSGSHPGGGMTCAPGAFAARKILRDRN